MQTIRENQDDFGDVSAQLALDRSWLALGGVYHVELLNTRDVDWAKPQAI